MRALYLTEEAITFSGPLVRGGAIHVRNVVTGLRGRGHDVRLVDWNDDPERPFQHSVDPRVRPVEGALRTYRRAVAVGRETDVQVVVSKTRKTYHPGLLAARRLGVPHAVHVGSSLAPADDSLRSRLDATAVEARLRLPHDAYLVVCDHIADELRERGVRGDVFDVRNAVDAEAFNPESGSEASRAVGEVLDRYRDAFRLGYVGGLHDYKGVSDLADALGRVEADVHLFVAGDGPARERFERETGARATFLGAVPYEAIPAVYGAVDALVLPSHTEGLPRVVLEAMATETPVVATRVGGVPEVVDDGEAGLLCAPHNPDALGRAIERLAQDAELADRLGRAGRERVVESFTWKALYDRFEAALTSLAEGEHG